MSAQPTFSMIPTREELAGIERDIRFFPSHNDDPKLLRPADIDTWNLDGYLGPLDVYDAEEINDIRRYFDQLLAETLAAGKDSYSISTAHLKHYRVWDMLTHPTIVGYVRDLLGEDVVGWGSHFFCKMPGDGKSVHWHQDCSYWPITPSKTITVWLAIDDADEENGCMQVFTGSHTYGLIEYETSQGDDNVLDQMVEHPERYGTPRLTPLKAGQISMHSDLLLHGSAPNNSQRRRCGLTLRYCPADVVAHLDWNRKGVIVSGHADPDRWPGATRPETP